MSEPLSREDAYDTIAAGLEGTQCPETDAAMDILHEACSLADDGQRLARGVCHLLGLDPAAPLPRDAHMRMQEIGERARRCLALEAEVARLRAAWTQRMPDGESCAICGDNGHQAFECRFHPLTPPPTWRCFHCNETFTDAAAAETHFGLDRHGEPMCIQTLTLEVTRLRVVASEVVFYWQCECSDDDEQPCIYCMAKAALLREVGAMNEPRADRRERPCPTYGVRHFVKLII